MMVEEKFWSWHGDDLFLEFHAYYSCFNIRSSAVVSMASKNVLMQLESLNLVQMLKYIEECY